MLHRPLARGVAAGTRVRREAGTVPLLIKIAPDLTLAELDGIVSPARKHRIAGMIVGNTTLARPPTFRERTTAREPGGRPPRPPSPLPPHVLASPSLRPPNPL